MLKKLASETAIYGISSTLARLINYLLVFLHTYAFETSSYGIVAKFYAWAAILNILYTYGMETAYFRFASKKGADSERVYNSALSSLLLTGLLFSGTGFFFSGSIAGLLGHPESGKYVQWFALIVLTDAVTAIPFARLRIEKKALVFASIKVAVVTVNVLLNVFFLYFCRGVYDGEFWQEALPFVLRIYDPELGLGYAFFCNMLSSLLALPLLWRPISKWRFHIDPTVYRQMLRYAYPLVFSGLAYTVNEVLDRLLLEHWLPVGFYPGKSSLDAVGIYASCYKLSIFITLAVQGYRYAAEPFFFSKAADTDKDEAYALALKYFVLACTAMFVVISANVELIGSMFLRQAAYREGLDIVPFLLMANVMLGIYYNLSIWFKISDQTKFGAYISIAGAFVTLLGNWLLIPVLGYTGAALATLGCYTFMATACYFLGRRYHPIPYDLKSALYYLGVSSACVGGMYFFYGAGVWTSTLAGNLLALLFFAAAFWKEKKGLARLLARLRHKTGK